METLHISIIKTQFEFYKDLGDKTLAQLTFSNLVYVPDPSSNNIAIIVKHLSGNMLSRWTNFLHEDGEKTWRERDREFENSYNSKEEIIDAWETGWSCFFEAISPLSDTDLSATLFIRNQKHTVEQALLRQLGHYAYHIGQLVFIGKMIKKEAWKTLSIAKGKSTDYNRQLFDKVDKSK